MSIFDDLVLLFVLSQVLYFLLLVGVRLWSWLSPIIGYRRVVSWSEIDGEIELRTSRDEIYRRVKRSAADGRDRYVWLSFPDAYPQYEDMQRWLDGEWARLLAEDERQRQIDKWLETGRATWRRLLNRRQEDLMYRTNPDPADEKPTVWALPKRRKK